MKIKILVSILISLLLSCSGNSTELLEQIKVTVEPLDSMESGYKKVISLDSLTNFEWDSVYMFYEHQDGRYISEIIGFEWNGPKVPNISQRLLFVNKNRVVKFVDFNNDDLPLGFLNCSDKYIFSKENAKFITFKYCDSFDTTYYFIPVHCLKVTDRFADILNHGCPK